MRKTGVLFAGALLLSACSCLAQDLHDPAIDADEFPVSNNAENSLVNQEFPDVVREGAENLTEDADAEAPDIFDAVERNEVEGGERGPGEDLVEAEEVENASVVDRMGDEEAGDDLDDGNLDSFADRAVDDDEDFDEHSNLEINSMERMADDLESEDAEGQEDQDLDIIDRYSVERRGGRGRRANVGEIGLVGKPYLSCKVVSRSNYMKSGGRGRVARRGQVAYTDGKYYAGRGFYKNSLWYPDGFYCNNKFYKGGYYKGFKYYKGDVRFSDGRFYDGHGYYVGGRFYPDGYYEGKTFYRGGHYRNHKYCKGARGGRDGRSEGRGTRGGTRRRGGRVGPDGRGGFDENSRGVSGHRYSPKLRGLGKDGENKKSGSYAS